MGFDPRKAKRYAIIASVTLNVMIALGIVGYAYCAGSSYIPLPSFQSSPVDPDMQIYNTAKQALVISQHSVQPAKTMQASYQKTEPPIPGRNPFHKDSQ